MTRWTLLLCSSLLATAGCAAVAGSGSESKPRANECRGDDCFDTALSDYNSLFDGVPDGSSLPSEGKADGVYPEKYDLVATQSEVKSQGRRGVCSVFSTVGLVEHLYIAGGAMGDPDFSEQYVQWSVKSRLRAFPRSSGSNARSNLQAINQFGVPLENAWPYEIEEWDETVDPECKKPEEGESKPTRCYTNGEPPQTALDAEHYFVPAGRWINPDVKSIQAHISTAKTAVVIGLEFYYQSWNHRRSDLPTNAEYFRQGYVLAPNAEDRRVSAEKRAGHSILIVGWDDNLELQMMDEDGNPAVDSNGDPITQTGFFLFKNSWGQDKFGIENEFGPGYGWIAYEYAKEGRAYVSALPQGSTVEICTDGEDNNGDGAVDCDDAACATSAACQQGPSGDSFTSEPNVAIPDYDTLGVEDTIAVSTTGTTSKVNVAVEVTHAYRGDVTLILEKDGRSAVLVDQTGGAENDIDEVFEVPDLVGVEASGDWTLRAIDNAPEDTGTLVRWSLDLSTN